MNEQREGKKTTNQPNVFNRFHDYVPKKLKKETEVSQWDNKKEQTVKYNENSIYIYVKNRFLFHFSLCKFLLYYFNFSFLFHFFFRFHFPVVVVVVVVVPIKIIIQNCLSF